MGSELHVMYTQLVEKLEYQNREAAEHDHELKKGVFKLKSDINEGQAKICSEIKTLVKYTKIIIIMQVANVGVTGDYLSMVLKYLL